MTTIASNPTFQKIYANRGMIFPVSFIGLLVVLLVPLPTQILDILLLINITLSVVVMVTTIYVKSPLEFSIFPSLLLAVTLFRLVLNVATTRLILTADSASTPEEALYAAGNVVHAFTSFVTSGSLAVGIIIFIIIFVIQFVVITKGGGRISEVAARFTLDAMPGKQMAIDADLNAGVINEAEARKRREEISQEADFYGAMDGASKFVRGDAIAGLVITFINILGGIYVGMVEHGWGLMDCLGLYTRMTIGDGLVSQIPAFIISLGAGLIVTRTSTRKDLGDEMLNQLSAKPKALMIAAIFLLIMSVTGMPIIYCIVLSACCGGLALTITKNEKNRVRASEKKEQEKVTGKKEPEKVEKLLDVDTMELEVGYGLVRMVDAARGGDLLDRISLIRRQVAMDMGIIVPPVRIRDNMQLSANDYLIKIKGQVVARGVTYPDQFMAMDNGATTGPIVGGTLTTEPAFGLPAYWITESERQQAELQSYTVVEATAVLATHLTEVIKGHAAELLTRQEIKNLIDNLKQRVPALVEEVIPTQVKPGELQKVMQNLLRERVPVRDLETILETMGDYASRTKDVEVLTEYVRNALSRTICKQYVDDSDRLWCVTLDPALEDMINSHIERSERGVSNNMPPQTAQQISRQVADRIAELTQSGRSAVVLCSPQIRAVLRRIIEGALPQVAVLAYNEVVPEVAVEAVAMVGLNG